MVSFLVELDDFNCTIGTKLFVIFVLVPDFYMIEFIIEQTQVIQFPACTVEWSKSFFNEVTEIVFPGF